MVNKNTVVHCLQDIHNQKFVDHFHMQEDHQPRWEASAYLLSLEKTEVPLPADAFLLLMERLEYWEQEWAWEEKSVTNSNRRLILCRVIDPLIRSGLFKEIDVKHTLGKLDEQDIEFDYRSIVTADSTNSLIYDEWNDFLLFGCNAHHYYVIRWYTTA
ncbi:hypothetical protein [Brevibacillus sp. 179-C9.3 HS]|uniref:hypothetical protein n=1 Tax=unclassified Brevibacillus TaxID=2684853 RepID=UPI0039A2E5B6